MGDNHVYLYSTTDRVLPCQQTAFCYLETLAYELQNRLLTSHFSTRYALRSKHAFLFLSFLLVCLSIQSNCVKLGVAFGRYIMI